MTRFLCVFIALFWLTITPTFPQENCFAKDALVAQAMPHGLVNIRPVDKNESVLLFEFADGDAVLIGGKNEAGQYCQAMRLPPLLYYDIRKQLDAEAAKPPTQDS